MCADWAKHGLKINGIAPGYFKTELNPALVDKPEFAAGSKSGPRGPLGQCRRARRGRGILVRKASSFVNGHTLYVDGGFTTCL